MVSILLATGMEQLDSALIKYLQKVDGVSYSKQKVYFREGLGDAIERNDPEVIVLSEYLEGNTLSMEQLIRIVRKKYPDKQLIYILKSEESLNLKTLLFRVGVYDVYSLEPKLNVKELVKSVFRPKLWKDVANQIPELEENESFEVGDVALEKDIKYNAFAKEIPTTESTALYNSTLFWSPRQQSGSTTLAINSAVMLAQVNGPCLLIDFNVNNPNIHTQLSVVDEDGNHNLNALCEDIEDGSFNDARMVEFYLTKHPFYNDLHILPGAILKQPKPEEKTLKKALDAILTFASAAGYTSLIIDTDSGLNYTHQFELIKAVDKIIAPVLENPGTVISAQKMFDTEFGPFYLNLLDMKKIKFVFNMASSSEEGQKLKRVLQSYLNKRIDVEIPYSQEVQFSTLVGAPFVREKPQDEQLTPYLRLANLVHDVFKIDEGNKNESKFFGLFKKTKG